MRFDYNANNLWLMADDWIYNKNALSRTILLNSWGTDYFRWIDVELKTILNETANAR
jgi:hypothetical protein